MTLSRAAFFLPGQGSLPSFVSPSPAMTTGSAKTTSKDAAAATSGSDVAEPDKRLQRLIQAMADGDQGALAELYDATVGRVYGIALRITRNTELAEEVVSDTYFQVWRDASRYDAGRGRVLGWLLVICRSRALDALRRQDEAISHPEPHELAGSRDDGAESANDPFQMLASSRSERQLHAALAKLSALQRQLIGLAFFRGLSHSEIQEHTGIPLGSVKTHIRKALAILREVVSDTTEAPRRKGT